MGLSISQYKKADIMKLAAISQDNRVLPWFLCFPRNGKWNFCVKKKISHPQNLKVMVSAESIKSSRLQQGYYQTSNNNNNNHNPAANNSIVASAANNSASNISNGNNFGTELLFDDDEAGDITNTSPVAAQVLSGCSLAFECGIYDGFFSLVGLHCRYQNRHGNFG